MTGELFGLIWAIAGYGLLFYMFLPLITGMLGGWKGMRTVPTWLGGVVLLVVLGLFFYSFFRGVSIPTQPLFIAVLVMPIVYLINIAVIFLSKKEWIVLYWWKAFRGVFIFFVVLLAIWIAGLIIFPPSLP